MKSVTTWLSAISLGVFTSTATATPLYQFEDIGTLGGPEAAALDINDSGSIVGWSSRDNKHECTTDTSDVNCHFAFLYHNGQMLDLGTASAIAQHTEASRINRHGDIIGYQQETSSNGWHYVALQFVDGKAQALPTLSGDSGLSAVATDINDSGDIVGWSDSSDQQDTAVIWQQGQISAVAIHESFFRRALANNNLGDIAGFEYERWSGKPNRGFVLTPDGFTQLQSAEELWSDGWEINDYGMIAGSSTLRPFSSVQATIWYPSVAGGLTQHVVGGLSDQPGIESIFFDINRSGSAVGFSTLPNGNGRAIAFIQGELYDLNNLVEVEGTLTTANGINRHGDIVGSYINHQGIERAYLLRAIAE
ncbi:hypothetical protein CHH28_14080 [Bacterioplanes sanyensis]|uniref:HAF repeat-containing protein n=1 Tax=Bacterioplanes sanyensis TaxID=1249553 RepID=A0A222FMY2_9GAMM|nr:DUF3466 family protein [Bacterioplanes sanyensis]ASP39731.1 hypothetical protein CHH28_14080 [Bacterioplanes sanyensis]